MVGGRLRLEGLRVSGFGFWGTLWDVPPFY